MHKRTNLITCKECKDREELIQFLYEFGEKWNLKNVLISIVKSIIGYEVFYIDYSKETEQDRLL